MDCYNAWQRHHDPDTIRGVCSRCKKLWPIEDFPWIRKKENPIRGSLCKHCINAKAVVSSRSLHYRWRKAKSRAIRFGIEWSITEDLYIELMKYHCQYCEGHLNTTGSGLDRVQPKLGYFFDNVVTCCKRCNAVKSDYFNYDEMMLLKPTLIEIRKARELKAINDGK